MPNHTSSQPFGSSEVYYHQWNLEPSFWLGCGARCGILPKTPEQLLGFTIGGLDCLTTLHYQSLSEGAVQLAGGVGVIEAASAYKPMLSQ